MDEDIKAQRSRGISTQALRRSTSSLVCPRSPESWCTWDGSKASTLAWGHMGGSRVQISMDRKPRPYVISGGSGKGAELASSGDDGAWDSASREFGLPASFEPSVDNSGFKPGSECDQSTHSLASLSSALEFLHSLFLHWSREGPALSQLFKAASYTGLIRTDLFPRNAKNIQNHA